MLRFLLLFVAAIPALVAQMASPASVPAMWSQRLTVAQRDRAIRATSVTPWGDIVKKTEDAVARGIGFLLKQQNADGSWGSAEAGAQTGLALLAIMGSGNFPLIKERDQAIRRAVSWLILKRRETPEAFDGDTPDPLFHATATLALLEYQTLSGDHSLNNDLAAAIDRIISNQDLAGGWRRTDINFDQNEPCLAAWNLLVLQQALALKIPVDGLSKALDRGARLLARREVWRPELLGRQELILIPKTDSRGNPIDSRGKGGNFETMVKQAEPQRPLPNGEWGGTVAFGQMWIGPLLPPANPGMFLPRGHGKFLVANFWWSITMEAFGKVTAQNWHQTMRSMLLDSQLPDGSWPPQRGIDHDALFGPIESCRDTPEGRMCRTALSVLILESPYRLRLVTPPR